MSALLTIKTTCDALFDTQRVGESTLEYIGNFCLTTVQLASKGDVIRVYQKEDADSGGKEGYQLTEKRSSSKSKRERLGCIALSIVLSPLLPFGLILKPLSLLDPEVKKRTFTLIKLKKAELGVGQKVVPINAHKQASPLAMISLDIMGLISMHLDFKDVMMLSMTCQSFRKVQNLALIKLPLMKVWNVQDFLKLPEYKFHGIHCAGKDVSGTLCLQKNGSNQLLTKINFIEPAELKTNPIMRFCDPWGRTGVFIRFTSHHQLEKGIVEKRQHVIALYPISLPTGHWTSGISNTSKTKSDVQEVALNLFFRAGWETTDFSFNYLKRLVKKEPCGLPYKEQTLGKPLEIKEGPQYIEGSEQSVVEIS